jgi:hypothetical protein
MMVWLYERMPDIIIEAKKRMLTMKSLHLTEREKIITQAKVCYMILGERGILEKTLEDMNFVVPLDERQLREYYLAGKIHTNAFSDLFVIPTEAIQGVSKPLKYLAVDRETKELSSTTNTSTNIDTSISNTSSTTKIDNKKDTFRID